MFLLCQCEVVFLVVVSATASVSIGDRDAGGTSFSILIFLKPSPRKGKWKEGMEAIN